MKKKIGKMSSIEINRKKGKASISLSLKKQKAIDELIKNKKNIKLNLGCGNIRFEGYINIDVTETPATDIIADIVSLPMFPGDCVDEIQMNAVFEHLYRYQQKPALKEWLRILKPGGKLIINWIPDFDVVIDAYLKRERGIKSQIFDLSHVSQCTFGQPDPLCSPHNLHKDVFTKESVRELLLETGFEIVKLENSSYKDEHIPLNINVIAIKPKN